MASRINTSSLDITYPIAGQDNDTQGFRTNWVNIQQNFTVAASEISALQSNVANSPRYAVDSFSNVAVPYSNTSTGFPGQMAYGNSTTSFTIAGTANSQPAGNVVTVSSIRNLEVGMPVSVSSNIGNLLTTTTYYITGIVDSSHITLGPIANASKQVALANVTANGTITGTSVSTFLYVCVATNSWVRTPMTTWIAA